MRIYIAGPMTGIEDHNYPAFREAARELKSAGYTVCDPSRHEVDDPSDWHQWMRAGLEALSGCDGLATLEGWKGSLGASIEVAMAKWMNIGVNSVADWMIVPRRRPTWTLARPRQDGEPHGLVQDR